MYRTVHVCGRQGGRDVKHCRICDQPKPLDEFYKHSKTLDGRGSYCKPCQSAYAMGKQAMDPKARAVAQARYRAKHSGRLNAYRSRHHKMHPERGRRYSATRNAAKLAVATVPFTDEQLRARWAYYGDRCWMCGAEAAHTDHVKPLSKGGAHMLCNLRPACASCNLRKNNRWPFQKLNSSLPI